MKYDEDMERAAIAAYQAAPTSKEGRAAGDVLVKMHTPLVNLIVKKYQNHLVTFADLRQEGSMALLRAAKRYDGRGKLSSYARTAIAMAALSYRWRLGSDLTAGDNTQQAADLLRRADESGKSPADFVPAGHPSLKMIERASADLRLLGQRASRLDAPLREGYGSLSERIASPENDVEETIQHQRQIEVTMAELEKLRPMEREVLERLYLIDKPETGREIADSHGISRQRVDQIKSEALVRVRSRIRLAMLRKGASL